MTQYKDKAGRSDSSERISTGLLAYPVLMACDILLYSADEVPVGEDQKQHVELSRDIAQRFNHLFGETFVVPEPVIPEVGARIMGFDDPTRKMAKSYENTFAAILVKMVDEPKVIERTIKRAVTDSGNEIVFSEDPAKAGVNNLLGIYQVITGKDRRSRWRPTSPSARGYGDLKSAVAEVVIEELRPIRERYNEIMDDAAELDRVLAKGAERAGAVANAKLREMKERMGLCPAGRWDMNGPYYPSLEEVERLADQGNMVPVYREVSADLETPVSAYIKVARPPYSFLLES